MAANDEFPRGGSFSTVISGLASGSFTLPSCPGIVHVLDEVDVVIANTANTNIGTNIDLNSSDGIFSNYVLDVLVLAAVPAAADVNSITGTYTGPISASPGSTLSVAFNFGATASAAAVMTVKWHDI